MVRNMRIIPLEIDNDFCGSVTETAMSETWKHIIRSRVHVLVTALALLTDVTHTTQFRHGRELSQHVQKR